MSASSTVGPAAGVRPRESVAKVADPRSVLAGKIADACAGVVGVSSLWAGGVATYLPGGTVPGVRLLGDGPDALEVHLVAAYGPDLPSVADAVRAALRGLVGRVPVLVAFEDLDVPPSLRP